MTISKHDSVRATAYRSAPASGSAAKPRSRPADPALQREMASGIALGFLGRYSKNFSTRAKDDATSHKQRILNAAKRADDDNDFNGLSQCWKNDDTASLRKIVTHLTEVTELGIDESGKIPPLTDAQTVELRELNGKENASLTRNERRALIRLSAQDLLKKEVLVIEFSQLGREHGIHELKKLFNSRQVHGSKGRSLTGELSKVFADLDKINANQAILDSKRREPIRSTLKAVGRLFRSSRPQLPRLAPTPAPRSAPTGASVQSKVRAFVDSSDGGSNGFGRKAESVNVLGKVSDPLGSSEGMELERPLSPKRHFVPQKDRLPPKAARMSTARIASSDLTQHLELEVSNENIEDMRVALKYLQVTAPEPVQVTIVQPTVRVPAFHIIPDANESVQKERALENQNRIKSWIESISGHQ